MRVGRWAIALGLAGWVMPPVFSPGAEPAAPEATAPEVVFQETVDQSEGLTVVTEEHFGDGACSECDVCGCDGGYTGMLSRVSVRLRGGLSYYNAISDSGAVDSRLGGTWGIDGVMPLGKDSDFGVYGAYKLNHASETTQTLASVGFYKQADGNSCSLIDRVGGSAIYDYFTDSRGNDLDLTAFRLQVGYALSADWAVGVRYVEPIEHDVDTLFFLAADGGPGATGLYKRRQSVAGFIAGYVNEDLFVDASVGDGDRDDDIQVSLLVRQAIGENVFVFTDTEYLTRGSWANVTGVEFRLGNPRQACGKRWAWDDPTIGQSFNAGEAKTAGTSAGGTESSSNAPPPPPPPPPPSCTEDKCPG